MNKLVIFLALVWGADAFINLNPLVLSCSKSTLSLRSPIWAQSRVAENSILSLSARLIPPPPPPRDPPPPPPRPQDGAKKSNNYNSKQGSSTKDSYLSSPIRNQAIFIDGVLKNKEIFDATEKKYASDIVKRNRFYRTRKTAVKYQKPVLPPPMLTSDEWLEASTIGGARDYRDLAKQYFLAKAADIPALQDKWAASGASKREILKRTKAAIKVAWAAKAAAEAQKDAHKGNKLPKPPTGLMFRYLHEQQSDGRVLPMSMPRRGSVQEVRDKPVRPGGWLLPPAPGTRLLGPSRQP